VPLRYVVHRPFPSFSRSYPFIMWFREISSSPWPLRQCFPSDPLFLADLRVHRVILSLNLSLQPGKKEYFFSAQPPSCACQFSFSMQAFLCNSFFFWVPNITILLYQYVLLWEVSLPCYQSCFLRNPPPNDGRH